MSANGLVLHAAYGPVPGEACPSQISRDAEDFAVMRAAELIIRSFWPRIDSAGTVGCVNGPRERAAGVKESRAHLWCRAFGAHPELLASKCKGHARRTEAQAGTQAALDKCGNDAADDFGREGQTAARGVGYQL